MQDMDLVQKVQGLTDIELAVLLSLVASQHCIIETEEEAIDALAEELQLIASNTFSLPPTVVSCSKITTLDQLISGLLIPNVGDLDQETPAADNGSNRYQSSSANNPVDANEGRKQGRSHFATAFDDGKKLANIIILKNLCLASSHAQIQVLELLRTNRIFTHTAVYAAPKAFALVILQSSAGPRLNKHLVDHLFISHYHDPEDGFTNLEEETAWIEDDRASERSVLHLKNGRRSPSAETTTFQPEDIQNLANLYKLVSVKAEIKVYVQNIVTFLRLHRAVGSGISPRATQHFDLLIKCLAPLHGLNYVTPSLVALAARKIYPHRIVIVSAPKERSMQYGSDLASVTGLLRDYTPESIVEEVLASVEAPL